MGYRLMSTSFDAAPDLPPALAWLGAHPLVPVTVGQSEASVWRIDTGAETLFLKSAPLHPLGELGGEAERLGWLNRVGFPAPSPRIYAEHDGAAWLLMTALGGADLTHLADAPDELCQLLADALRTLHDLDPSACPFDQRLESRLVAARRRIAAGLVDEDDFDAARRGWTAADVMIWLEAHFSPGEDLVVTHGDASLPNVLAENGRFTGMVDVGRLGVADRWQDLAIACRSIVYNCGPAYLEGFLSAYGTRWDAARYRYYCALDELF